jgi:hypothetical protein
MATVGAAAGEAAETASDLRAFGPTGIGANIGAEGASRLAEEIGAERYRVLAEFAGGGLGAAAGATVSATTGLAAADLLDLVGVGGAAAEAVDVGEWVVSQLGVENEIAAAAVANGTAETLDDAGRAVGEATDEAVAEAEAEFETLNERLQSEVGGAGAAGETADAGAEATDAGDPDRIVGGTVEAPDVDAGADGVGDRDL